MFKKALFPGKYIQGQGGLPSTFSSDPLQLRCLLRKCPRIYLNELGWGAD